MNEQLVKFIELCLTDGIITDKEREVIFRKAAEYNVDIDECEIILESMIQQKNMSQNMENSSNTETQVSVPKYLLGGYKMHIAIENGENPRTVEINMGDDEEAFGFMFESFFSSGFNSGLNFLNKLIPQDEFVTDLINKYSKGSENRKIKKYPNGDYYEGKIVNEKANGFGELNIMINDLLFMKYTQYIGEFTNDTFFKGKIYCYNSDDEGDIIKFIDVEYLDSKYKCRSIEYPNDDKFEGDVVNFKRHGKGKLTKADGSVIEGNWENDTFIKDKTIPFDLILSIHDLYSDNKYQELVYEAEVGELEYENIFEDTDIAKKYLWSLMEVDLERAYEEIDRITKIASDEVMLNDTIGVIYKKKGEKNQDLNLLEKALNCFQSYYYFYSNKEFATNRINNVQEIINKINSNNNKELEAKKISEEAKKVFPGSLLNQEKLKSLGVNSEIIKQFTNNDYKKLWKVSCLITEPYYNYQNTISSWQNSNPNFFIPSNGIINEKGAVAFIKANWTNIYVYRVDKYWEKKGRYCDKFKSFDKTKIEIIEINEIV